jgi:hypothetical protein
LFATEKREPTFLRFFRGLLDGFELFRVDWQFAERLPVAANIALIMAGTMAEVPAAPIPPGGSKFWTMWTSMAGASFMRTIW